MIGLLQLARAHRRDVEVVPDDESGQLSVDALREMLDDRVRLVAMSWIPTQGGLVNPAAAVGAVDPRRRASPTCSTRARPRASCPIDVDALGCDFLSATGRKYLRGPAGHRLPLRAARRGSSASTRRSSTSTRRGGHRATTWSCRADARRFESWERSVANRLGLGAAVDYALALGVDAIADAGHRARRASLREQLAPRPGPDPARPRRRAVRDRHLHRRRRRRVRARRRACATQRINISVSTIDFAALRLRSAWARPPSPRASVHYYNTEDELTRLVDAVADCTARSPQVDAEQLSATTRRSARPRMLPGSSRAHRRAAARRRGG